MERRVAARSAFSGRKPTLKRTCSASALKDNDSDSEDCEPADQWNAFLSELDQGDKTLEFFWYDVKLRLVARHGAIGLALNSLNPNGEGLITFYIFERMMVSIGITLDNRVMRKLFRGMSRDNLHLNLQVLESALMKRTVAKLTHTMRGFAKGRQAIHSHIQNFLQCLAEVDSANQLRSADRFQRKLTVPFCRGLWSSVRDARTASTGAVKGISSALVDQEVFFKAVAERVEQQSLLTYEGDYLRRIFQHMDVRGARSIPTCDLIVGTVLLSPEVDRRKKIDLVFEVFDTDNDGCLTYNQIMDLMMCISTQRAIVECNPLRTKTGGPALQKELSAQEGQRTYECVRWHLERQGEVKDAVNSVELWEALQEQPQMLYSILPSTAKLHAILGVGERGTAAAFDAKERGGDNPSSFFAQNRTVLTKSSGFAKAVTSGFRQSLRERGARRLTNLTESLSPLPQVARPSQDPPPSASSPRSNGDEPSPRDTEGLTLAPVGVQSQLWGAEAAHRYKIFQMAKSRRSRAEELRLRRERKQERDEGQPSAECIAYDCRICRHAHHLRPNG